VYWADVDTSVLVVGLSGTILGESLYQQKNTLDVFVDVLQANSSISSVLVLESPVDAAMNNEHSVQDASAFHIKLIVGNL